MTWWQRFIHLKMGWHFEAVANGAHGYCVTCHQRVLADSLGTWFSID